MMRKTTITTVTVMMAALVLLLCATTASAFFLRPHFPAYASNPRLMRYEDIYKKQFNGVREMFDMMDAISSKIEEGYNDQVEGEKGGQVLASSKAGVFQLTDTGKEYQLAAHLPDVKPDNIQIEMNENVLTVKAEKVQEKSDDKGKWHFRSENSWVKSMTLDKEVKPDDVSARFENGDLIVSIKKPEKVEEKPKLINIPIKHISASKPDSQ
jgi:HSP20 family protein